MSSQPETVTARELSLNPNNQREREILLVEREFALNQRRANMLAASTIAPKEYQGNIANCVIAMEMAKRLNTGELEIMQNLHIIHGRPSFSSAYLIARINTSGILKGRLKFRMTGEKGTDTYGCIAYGIDRETEEELTGTEVTIKMAKDQGWWSKNGSKWPVMTEQMLQYRAAAFWSRINAPDATMGMHTEEEVQDVEIKDITPPQNVSNIQEAIDKKLGVEAEEPEEAEVVEVNANPETGEIEVQDHSPSYIELHKKLLNTENEEQAKALLEYGIFKKMKNSERAMLTDAVMNRCNAFNM